MGYHDLAAHKQILADAFARHDEWKIPELIDAAHKDPELYFDSVSQINMPSWHQGRIVLVGDAAHCASNLSGRGTSLALTGTWFLAQALRDHSENLQQAFEQYEHDQRPHVSTNVRTSPARKPPPHRAANCSSRPLKKKIDARNRRLNAQLAS